MIKSKKRSGKKHGCNRKTRRSYNHGGSKGNPASPKKSPSPQTEYDDAELVGDDGSQALATVKRPRQQPMIHFTPAQIRQIKQFNKIRANIMGRPPYMVGKERGRGPGPGITASSRRRLFSSGMAQRLINRMTAPSSSFHLKLVSDVEVAQKRLVKMVQTNYMPIIYSVNGPADIALDRGGNIVVADSGNNYVVSINPFTGAVLQKIAFRRPYSLSFLFDENGITDQLIVVDLEGVYLVDYATGQRIRTIRDSQNGYIRGLPHPTEPSVKSVLYDGAVHLRVNGEMLYYNTRGKQDRDNTLPIPGSGYMAYYTKNKFKYNESIIVPGHIYKDGTLYQTLSEKTKGGEVIPIVELETGSGPRQALNISGIAVDCVGNVIVIDKGNNRIQIFNPDFTKVRIIGKQGNAYGEFWNPEGVAVDCHGNIFVCDYSNQRIQVIRYNL